MDRQLAFETAVAGILAQNALAVITDEVYRCVYFDPATQSRCAIGQLITPERAAKWEKKFGGIDARACVQKNPSYLGNFGKIEDGDLRFLNALQQLHDISDGINGFKSRLPAFATDWGLNHASA